MLKTIMFVVGIIFLNACTDDPINPNDTEYIIFGSFYGECFGEQCIEIFKLDKTNFSEDTNDVYPNATNFYVGNFVQRDFSIIGDLVPLMTAVPDQLFDEKNRIIGQPDAGDWGGYYFEIKRGDLREFWLIDTHRDNLPSYILPFEKLLEEKLQLLAQQ